MEAKHAPPPPMMTPAPLFFRLPVIRHIRYFYLVWKMNRHYRAWARLGFVAVWAESDLRILEMIWEGTL